MLTQTRRLSDCGNDNCCQMIRCSEQKAISACESHIKSLNGKSVRKLRWYFRSQLIKQGFLSILRCAHCVYQADPLPEAASNPTRSAKSNPSSSASSTPSLFNIKECLLLPLLLVLSAAVRWIYMHIFTCPMIQ